MEKVYSRINFEDRPSKNTPLNAENLNKMDSAIDALDDRIVEQDEAFEEYKIAESEQMSEAYERIRELEGTFSDHDSRISDAEGNIESLQADVTGVKKNVSKLEGDVNNNYEAFYSFREGAREDIENLQAADITIKESIETFGTRLDKAEDNIPSLTNDLLATQAGTALDAVQGKALNDALTAFIDQINRDYYGTNGTAPVFDLMPNGTTGTVLSRLGGCYISSSEQITELHAPSVGYAFAFGSARDRYGIIFIGRGMRKIWFRTDATEWIEIDASKLEALYTRMDKFSLSNGRTMLASDLVTDLNDIDFNCTVNADGIVGESAYVANCPLDTGWFFVQTFRHSQSADYRKQIAYRMDTPNTMIYIRSCLGGTWSDWVQK